ncbi:MAG: molybdopterin molybdotransferase MoeA [Cyclobacteriaceae bacterium]|nr:molybdopterin molybdotransferase MoeA [Cyclobacteriaceae bacterium]
MISVEEATHHIHAQLLAPRIEHIPLADCTGRFLGDDIAADRDLPPYPRVTMDGIALSVADFQAGQRTFVIQATQAAGMPPERLLPRQCVEVMTGAVLPHGATAVVRYEDIRINSDSHTATVVEDALVDGQNIHPQGTDAPRGALLIARGTRLSAIEVAVLASAGIASVPVFCSPRILIVGTGNEVVSVEATPEAWQVRQSNASALRAAIGAMGLAASQSHLPDDEAVMEDSLRAALATHDVLILSGGVSKGRFDFIPAVLKRLGVQEVFHQVAQKPGKPLWFGRSKTATVFGLPGNPVSTLVCFYRYIQPWLLAHMGASKHERFVTLAAEVLFKPALTYFLPVTISAVHTEWHATPSAGGGSGDFVNLLGKTGFIELPPTKTVFRKGEAYPFYAF